MEGGSFQPPLYNVYCTMHEMLRDRGYILPARNKTPEEYELDFCEEGLIRRDAMTLSLVHAQDRTRNIRVFFVALGEGGKVGKKQLEHILSQLDELRTRVIIVLSDLNNVTSHATRHIDDMNRAGKVHVQIFSESELMTNRTHVGRAHHVYTILSAKEKEDVRRRYPPLVRRVHAVAYNDFLAKYFGLQHQDMLKCTRASETAGDYTTYKLCLYPEEVPKEIPNKKRKI